MGKGYATAAVKMAEIARQTQFLDSLFSAAVCPG